MIQKSKALQIFQSLKDDKILLQKKLALIFPKENLKPKKVILLKDKLIFQNQYKLTVLVNLGNPPIKDIILEFHDNADYFYRNLFALKNFPKIKIETAKLFGFFEKEKIIVRECLRGQFLIELLRKKVLNFKQLSELTKKSGFWLAKIHCFSLKTDFPYLKKKLNRKIEREILAKTIRFIKPNIKDLKPTIERNLSLLLKKMDELAKINKLSLIHGDYQAANFWLGKKGLRISDFDTLELGNPARDLGRFLWQLSYSLETAGCQQEKIEKLEEIFLEEYLNYNKIKLEPDFKTNISCHKAEMIQYIILGEIWGKNIPKPEMIKKLLDKQSQLL